MAEDDNQIDVTISEMGSDYEGNQSTACENDYIWQSDGDLSDEETRKWPKKSLKCKRQPKRARKEANAKTGKRVSKKIQEATSTSKAQNENGKANPEKDQSKNKIQDFPGLTERHIDELIEMDNRCDYSDNDYVLQFDEEIEGYVHKTRKRAREPRKKTNAKTGEMVSTQSQDAHSISKAPNENGKANPEEVQSKKNENQQAVVHEIKKEIKEEVLEDSINPEIRRKIEFDVKKNLFEKFAQSVSCLDCKMISRGPIYQHLKNETDEYQIRCESCVPKNPGHIGFKRNKMLEDILSSLGMTCCRYRRDGCREVFEIKDNTDLYQHEDDCKSRKVPCPFERCSRIWIQDLKLHLKRDHGKCLDSDSIHEMIGKIYSFNINKINIEKASESQTQWTLNFIYKGQVFLLNVIVDRRMNKINYFQFWVQYFGGKIKSTNYVSKIQIGDQRQGKLSYEGPIKCIDDKKSEVQDSGFGLIVDGKSAKKYISNDGSLNVKVEIEDLGPGDYAFDSDTKI